MKRILNFFKTKTIKSMENCIDFLIIKVNGFCFFYPKDDTPGYTKEACAIRDAFPI
jgi:peroxiredoxin